MVTPDFVRPGATVIDVGQIVVTDPAEAQRIFANFPAKLESFRDERLDSCGRRSSGCRECRGRVHAGSRRRGPADDRHADEQHGESGAHAARRARARRPHRCAPLMLRVGLTGGIASGKSTVASHSARSRMSGARRRSAGPRTARARTGGVQGSGSRIRQTQFSTVAERWIARSSARLFLPMPRSARG